MNTLQKYKERFEEIERMNLTSFERDKTIANLMTTIEIENGGINTIIGQQDELTEFYKKISFARKF